MRGQIGGSFYGVCDFRVATKLMGRRNGLEVVYNFINFVLYKLSTAEVSGYVFRIWIYGLGSDGEKKLGRKLSGVLEWGSAARWAPESVIVFRRSSQFQKNSHMVPSNQTCVEAITSKYEKIEGREASEIFGDVDI